MDEVRLLAFLLPQFHPIPENDAWWGNGFTEWTSVTRARPAFPGHYQPHLPADLGFYDLRLPEAREAQANLAKQYGIDGFCYYHYWFNGRRILERPFEEILASGLPDYPFCLCWANENWTRVWDGGDHDLLLEQNYNFKDDEKHIRSLLPAFDDPRYIKVEGKPLFSVYRTELLPDPKRTGDIWREIATKEGIGDLYLVRVESFIRDTDPREIGFDAAIEFAPDWRYNGDSMFDGYIYRVLSKIGLLPKSLTDNEILSYETLATGMLSKPEPSYIRFPCVTPGWDNSARRGTKAHIYLGSTPEKYAEWLARVIEKVRMRENAAHRMVFINAWNEWAEGNHLEPDQKWGRKYLEATLDAKLSQGERFGALCNRPPIWNYSATCEYFLDRYVLWRFKDNLKK